VAATGVELPASGRRGLLSAGFLLLAILLSIGAGSPSPENLAPIAAIGAVALLSRAVFFPETVRGLLGPFAIALDLSVHLGLVLAALSLTGGVTSDLYPLLLVDLVLTARLAGRQAARFLAAATVVGLALLPALTNGWPAAGPGLLPLVLRLLWPPALLAGLEVAGLGAPAPQPEAPRAGRAPARERSEEPRDARSEILHDLKSPLSVVRVYADLIAEGATRGEVPSDAHIESLRGEISLMESLVGGTGRSAGPPARPRTQRTDLVRVLSALSETYQAAQGERLRIEFIADRAEIPVEADPVSLQRAFRNILDNAVKYTPSGGQIRIRASVVSQHSFVVISDTGIGMTPEEQRHAFEYAWRGPAARASGAEGRGLGLALTRELLERNGGKISLLSEPGHGLEVTMMFPIPREARGEG